MADSVRQTIMATVGTMLSGISITNGYSNNYKIVQDWRRTPLDISELPAILYEDTDCEVEEHDHVFTRYKMTLVIWVVLYGTETGKTVRSMIADVIKCLGTDLTLGNKAYYLYPESDAVMIDQKDDYYGAVMMQFAVGFSTAAWDPLTLK